MTAVEYAEELINVILYYIDEEDKQRINEVFNDAKEMEKQQMYKCASFWRGKENEIEKPIFQQYYNETFKK